jgi:hypothetical protein
MPHGASRALARTIPAGGHDPVEAATHARYSMRVAAMPNEEARELAFFLETAEEQAP